MTFTKKVMKDELDDCSREFERQLNELNLKMKSLSHKYVVLKNFKMEKTEKDEKLFAQLDQAKEKYA